MKAQHTPGPWRIWRDMGSKEPVQIAGPSHDFVCQIAGENTQAPANARLIAAAPELLEALQAYAQLHDCKRHEMPESNENEGKEWLRTRGLAKAAIAKALGKDGE